MIGVPIAIVLLGCGAYLRRDKARGVMTTERTKIFNAALSGGMRDPENLERLSKAFAAEGLSEQAKLLAQRAALKRLPNEVKLARRMVWRKAIASKNKPVMLKLASAYDEQGCTSAAMRLREIASGLPDVIPVSTTVAGDAVATDETPDIGRENVPVEPAFEGEGEVSREASV